MTNTTASNQVAVLAFGRGYMERATVVTDGTHHKSFTASGAKDHKTLASAIAYLEGRGYHIITDDWYQ